MTSKFESLIQQVSKLYDLVVIDTPPVLAVTDAAVIGRYAGTSMLVTRFELSTLKEIQAAKNVFSLNGIALKGVIFNAVQVRSSSYYGLYGYHHYSYDSELT
jgi:tyrosine-protein kinase Etk/Wzc